MAGSAPGALAADLVRAALRLRDEPRAVTEQLAGMCAVFFGDEASSRCAVVTALLAQLTGELLHQTASSDELGAVLAHLEAQGVER